MGHMTMKEFKSCYMLLDDTRETPLASSLASFSLLIYINYKPKVKECLKREFISGCE